MNPIQNGYNKLLNFGEMATKPFQCITLLIIRLFVASVFLRAGLQKLQDFSTTVFLFEYEYSVPLLSPKLAAMLGTTAEIVLPLLIIFGILTRWSAFALFVFNIVAVLSYKALTAGEFAMTTVWGFIPTSIVFPTKGFEDHVVWGLLILVIIVFGAGRVSIDQLLRKKPTYHY
ncbi:DoxX family protein [Ostreibacterium oceani]|uniref:DoxX family membrane protein n=1 Tax=Ostreibacterium oceani TaxID=2654998 RepID=A0A6N7EU36_9GAMM|nr:DoxX family protein [Ostreibacterium oceani]MPV86061.1 DoxX family membrane protein [Ostreibacterium oceani]